MARKDRKDLRNRLHAVVRNAAHHRKGGTVAVDEAPALGTDAQTVATLPAIPPSSEHPVMSANAQP